MFIVLFSKFYSLCTYGPCLSPCTLEMVFGLKVVSSIHNQLRTRGWATLSVRAGSLFRAYLVQLRPRDSKPMFRAYTTRRVRAKRSPKTVLFRAYTTDLFPGFLRVSAVWAKRLRFKCLRARNIPGGNSFSKAAPYSIPKQQRGSALCLLTKQGPSQRLRWCNQPWIDSDDSCCHS